MKPVKCPQCSRTDLELCSHLQECHAALAFPAIDADEHTCLSRLPVMQLAMYESPASFLENGPTR